MNRIFRKVVAIFLMLFLLVGNGEFVFALAPTFPGFRDIYLLNNSTISPAIQLSYDLHGETLRSLSFLPDPVPSHLSVSPTGLVSGTVGNIAGRYTRNLRVENARGEVAESPQFRFFFVRPVISNGAIQKNWGQALRESEIYAKISYQVDTLSPAHDAEHNVFKQIVNEAGIPISESDLPKFGSHNVKVKIRTIDNQEKIVEVPVNFQRASDVFSPAIHSLEEFEGTQISAEDFITNKNSLPAGTRYEYQSQPFDTSVGNGKSASVSVVYPDDSVDVVAVNYAMLPNVIEATAQQRPQKYGATVTFVQDPQKSTMQGVAAYHVNSAVDVSLQAPSITPKVGWRFTGWDKSTSGRFGQDTTIHALYAEIDDILEHRQGDTSLVKPEGYVTVIQKIRKGTEEVVGKFYYNPTKNLKIADAPEIPGYIFKKFKKEGESALFDLDTPITEDITLVGEYKKLWTVSFQNEDSSVIATKTVEEGTKTDPSTVVQPTKNGGFRFVGWTKQGESALFDFSNTLINSDVVLVPKFEEIPKKDVVINEIGYRNLSEGRVAKGLDYLELYNPTDEPIDLGGFQIVDSSNAANIVIPQGMQIPAKGYFVIANSATEFSQKYGSQPNMEGNLNLGHTGTSSNQYSVALQDNFGRGIDSHAWGGNNDEKFNNRTLCRLNGESGVFVNKTANTFTNECQQTPNASNSKNQPTIILSNNQVNHNGAGLEVGDLSVGAANGIDQHFEYKLSNSVNQKYSNNKFVIENGKLKFVAGETTDYFAKSSYIVEVEVKGDRGAYARQTLEIQVIEPKYQVIHRFDGFSADKPQPSTIILPANQTDKRNGNQVSPSVLTFANVDDATLDGVWHFRGWDQDQKTVNKADVEFVGTWEFVPNKYTISHRFESVTAGKNLPANMETLQDILDKITGDIVQPIKSVFDVVSDAVEDGTWTFASWNPETITVNKQNAEFVGRWIFSPNTYQVVHTFSAGTSGKVLPAEIENRKPANQTGKIRGEMVSPTDFADKLFVDSVNDGTWTFDSWDANQKQVGTENVEFLGTWNFVPNTYEVNYRFVAKNTARTLPSRVLDQLPQAQNAKINDEVVSAPTATFTNVEEIDGIWSFDSWDAENKTINKANISFEGAWIFTPKGAVVKYVFESASQNQTLPAGISALKPTDKATTYGTTETPTAPTTNTFEVEDGTWTFKGYDQSSLLVDQDEERFVGTWDFTPALLTAGNGVEKPANYVGVTFVSDTGKGDLQGNTTFYVNPEKNINLIAPTVNPKVGFTFRGWDRALSGKFSQDTRINAQFNQISDVVPGSQPKPAGYLTVRFVKGEHGEFESSALTIYYVKPNTIVDLDVPRVIPNSGYLHSGWQGVNAITDTYFYETFTSDTTIIAQYREKPSVIKYAFVSGTQGKVLPNQVLDLKPNDKPTSYFKTEMPQNPANTGPIVDDVNDGVWNFVAYTPASIEVDEDQETFVGTWEFVDSVVPGSQTKPDGYVSITFVSDSNKGNVVGENVFYVSPAKEVTLTAPRVNSKTGFTHRGWDQLLTQKFSQDVTIRATFEQISDIVEGSQPKPAGYITITFASDIDKGDLQGNALFYVNPGKQVSLTAPSVIAKKGYIHVAWDQLLSQTFSQDTTINATYRVVEASAQNKIVKLSESIPVIEEFITNKENLPANTTFTWKGGVPVKNINSTLSLPKTIIVSYPGNDMRELNVEISFVDDIDPSIDPIADLTVTRNETIPPIAIVTNDNIAIATTTVGGLPKGLRFENGNIVGVVAIDADLREYAVLITTRDTAGNQVSKTFKITIQNQASKYSPQAKKQTVEVKTAPSPVQSIANIAALPSGTNIAWQIEPDFQNVGDNVRGVVLITYPDGSSEEVEVFLKVQDTTHPQITVNQAFDASVAKSHTINISAGDNYQLSTLKYGYVDVNDLEACKALGDYQNLLNGKDVVLTDASKNGKYVCVEATDSSGNKSFSLLPYPVNLDTQIPAGTITPDTTDWTNQNVNLTLRTTKPVQTPNGWTKVDAQTFTKVVPQNTAQTTIKVVDLVGNESVDISYAVSNIDKEKPVITSLSLQGNKSLIKDIDVQVNFAGKDTGGSQIKEYQCKINDGNWQVCSAPFTIANADLKEGENVISVKVVDNAGNDSVQPVNPGQPSNPDQQNPKDTITITKDTTPPNFTNLQDKEFDEDRQISAFNLQTNEPANIRVLGDLPDGISYDSQNKSFSGTPSQPGDYTITVEATDQVGNATQKTFKMLIKDKTPPVITLVDTNTTLTLVKGVDTYQEQSGTCVDNFDQNCDVQVNGVVDVNAVGKYVITYKAVDQAGNASQKTRTVNVVSGEVPVITLNGEGEVVVELGSVYQEEGATARDQEDDDATLTAQILIDSSAVKTDRVGIYQVTYNVSDSSGNPAPEVVRIVNVVDTVAPNLIPVDDQVYDEKVQISPLVLLAEDLDLSEVLVDQLPPGLSYDVATQTISGTPTKIGEYEVRVTARDHSQNQTSLTFKIVVRDVTPPVIRFTEPSQQPSREKTISFSAQDNHSDQENIGLSYVLIGAGELCDENQTFVSGSELLLNDESNNGKMLCARAEDEAGNVSYATSQPISGIDRTTPLLPILEKQRWKKGKAVSYLVPTQNADGVDLVIVSVGDLPAGLQYHNGEISGKPTKTGTYSVAVRYQNTAGNVVEGNLEIKVYTSRPRDEEPQNPPVIIEPTVPVIDLPVPVPPAEPEIPILDAPVEQPQKVNYQASEIYNPTIIDGICYTRRPYLGIQDSLTISTSEEFKKALSFLWSYEMTMYDSVDGYDPVRNLSREEAAKLFSQFAMNVLCRKPDKNLTVHYTDTADADPTLKPFITLAYQLGVMKGSGMGDGEFRPHAYISKAEVNAVLIRMILKSYLNEGGKTWYEEYNNVASALGIIHQGAGVYSVSRDNVALMLFRAYKEQVFDWRNVDYFSFVLEKRDLFLK